MVNITYKKDGSIEIVELKRGIGPHLTDDEVGFIKQLAVDQCEMMTSWSKVELVLNHGKISVGGTEANGNGKRSYLTKLILRALREMKTFINNRITFIRE